MRKPKGVFIFSVNAVYKRMTCKIIDSTKVWLLGGRFTRETEERGWIFVFSSIAAT